MTTNLVETIADAVLYEGYILYPYRPSAVKNQQRWNFGALCPQSYIEANAGTEACTMQTECLVQGGEGTELNVKVRFLHLLTREVGQVIADCQLPIADCGHLAINSSMSEFHYCAVASLDVNGQLFQTWQEAIEREVSLPPVTLDKAGGEPTRLKFSFPSTEAIEPLSDQSSGEILGALVRRHEAIEGVIEVQIADLGLQVIEPVINSAERTNRQPAIGNWQSSLKVTVRIVNRTSLDDADQRSRDEALMRSFVSTHTILKLRDGEFCSSLDPPEALREAAAGCSNVGTYPVLVGEEEARDCMLSSPIILYDYPRIAPESAGNLYDGTEIDEILTLRIMTLTDEEKREMRGADERARQILERTETLPFEQLMKMHGAMKGVKK